MDKQVVRSSVVEDEDERDGDGRFYELLPVQPLRERAVERVRQQPKQGPSTEKPSEADYLGGSGSVLGLAEVGLGRLCKWDAHPLRAQSRLPGVECPQ